MSVHISSIPELKEVQESKLSENTLSRCLGDDEIKQSDEYKPIEERKIGKEYYLECTGETQLVKHNVKITQETSPLKQVVKGFVLNKLSGKNVAKSTILSGIREKIVRHLENSEETLIIEKKPENTTSNGSEEYYVSSSIASTCELKSIVANDSETSTIEEAVECFEESISSDDIAIKKSIPSQSSSVSLPSSPLHQKAKKAVMVNSASVSHDDLRHSESTDISESFNETSSDPKPKRSSQLGNIVINSSDTSYLMNESSEDQDDSKSMTQSYTSYIFFHLKTIFMSLNLVHIFLLVSVVIHNIPILDTYVSFIFNSLVVGYMGYVCLSILLNNFLKSPVKDDEQREAPKILSRTGDIFKGCVNILKEEYDHNLQKNYLTDTVDLGIENHWLKISVIKKRSSEAVSENESSETLSYDLQGAKVNVIPKTLPRNRQWNKKYPICIILAISSDASSTSVSDYLFCLTDEENENTERRAIYFFALTDREKEAWFWALRSAAKKDDITPKYFPSKPSTISFSYASLLEQNDEDDSIMSDSCLGGSSDTELTKKSTGLNYESYMETLFKDIYNESLGYDISAKDPTPRGSVNWLNIALGRFFFDFLTQKRWSEIVIERIQKKLDKIIVPSFMDSLKVTDVDLGKNLPVIYTVSKPKMDNFGMWLDFDFEYNGSFQMTLETRLKINKGGAPNTDSEAQNDTQCLELDDSSDEDDSKNTSSNKSALITRIEKWVFHRHFQSVAQNKYVKKFVGDLSNVPLILTVEVNTVQGILAVNIPPVPSDRIWYGFRTDPLLSLNAYPKVGTREINLSPIVQLIVRQLKHEFKKYLVMPNMDDLVIPLMHASIEE